MTFVWLLLCAGAAQAGTDVYIGVGGSRTAARWAVGLPPLQPERPQSPEDAELGRKLHEVLRADLLFSRHVQEVAVPSAAAANDPSKTAADWRRAGAGFVLWAKAASVPPKMTVSVKLIDTASGGAVLERYYRQEERFWRSAAHRVADDVVAQLTGKPGIAQSRLAFVNDSTGSKEVHVIGYDGAGLARLTDHASIALLPRWSPDGRRLLFTSYKDGNPDLFELDLEARQTRPFLDTQGLNIAGGFSPDGTLLVLTLSRGQDPNLWLMDLPAKGLRRLTSHFGADSSPTFSPDGKEVAFVSDRSGNPQIHVLTVDTGKARRLTRLNWCDSPSWSPTGEWIVFAGRANPKDRLDIFLADTTGSHLRQLTHGEGTNEDPSWSPDGRFLAFTTTREGRRKLFIMDSDGSAPHAVGDIQGHSYTPSWSP